MTTVREVEMTAENLLLAFVIKWQGDWSDGKVPQRRRWIEQNGISLTDDELAAALARARERFFERPAEVFVCRSGPCRERAPITPPEDVCAYTRTECQGPCKHAPVATVRVGDRIADGLGLAVLPECDRMSQPDRGLRVRGGGRGAVSRLRRMPRRRGHHHY